MQQVQVLKLFSHDFCSFSIVTAHRAVNFSGITDISCRIYLLFCFFPRLNCRVLILFILETGRITPVPSDCSKTYISRYFLFCFFSYRQERSYDIDDHANYCQTAENNKAHNCIHSVQSGNYISNLVYHYGSAPYCCACH